MEVYLASFALREYGFDLYRTVEIAAKHCFAGVQLYLRPEFCGNGYLCRLAKLLEDTNLDVIVHLPELRQYNARYIEPTQLLLGFAQCPRAIVHFEIGMPIPIIPGVRIGLENARFGYCHEYMREWKKCVESCRTRCLVFDMLYLFRCHKKWLPQVHELLRNVLSNMGEADVLHLLDQSSLFSPSSGISIKDLLCPLGSGMLRTHLDAIAVFPGTKVIEFDRLDLALASKRVLETHWEYAQWL